MELVDIAVLRGGMRGGRGCLAPFEDPLPFSLLNSCRFLKDLPRPRFLILSSPRTLAVRAPCKISSVHRANSNAIKFIVENTAWLLWSSDHRVARLSGHLSVPSRKSVVIFECNGSEVFRSKSTAAEEGSWKTEGKYSLAGFNYTPR